MNSTQYKKAKYTCKCLGAVVVTLYILQGLYGMFKVNNELNTKKYLNNVYIDSRLK